MTRLFSKYQHDYLVSIVEGKTTNEIADMMNQKFNLSIKPSQIRCYKKNHRLKSNISTTFKLGMEPANKGTKGLYNVGGNKTSFKAGQKPHNYKPIGYERLDKDGYTLIKVSNSGPWHRRWKHKHKHLWEQEYGSIPPGHKLLFVDQNRQNISLDNLILVSNKQMATLNKKGLLSNDPDFNKTGIIMAELYQKISERKKG